jgi:hypothetical protein
VRVGFVERLTGEAGGDDTGSCSTAYPRSTQPLAIVPAGPSRVSSQHRLLIGGEGRARGVRPASNVDDMDWAVVAQSGGSGRDPDTAEVGVADHNRRRG